MAAPSDLPRVTKIRPPPPLDHARPLPGYAPDEYISGASRRLRALAALSGSLTDSLSPEDAATLVERKALSALGATSAVVVTFGTFPPVARPVVNITADSVDAPFHIVHAIGLSAESLASIERLSLDAPVPFADVARVGEPVFLTTEQDLRRYPDWGEQMIRAGARSAAIVPVWANGELRGVLGLSWETPRAFDEDERAFVLTLGVMCAQAIMRAHLKAAERRARDAAEHANQTKTQFLATISHELRTPMNAMLGYTALLAEEIDGPVSELQRDHLGRMRASGAHLLALINELLGYARIEAVEEVVFAEPVLLAAVVEDSLVLVRPLAKQQGLRIRVMLPVEPIELLTDARKLRQILVNLIANAVKFTSAGDVTLAARIDAAEGVALVHFEVTDTGCGIAPGDEEHIFQPYWQRDPTVTHGPASGSTGLGLWVARKLAHLLGGDVTVGRSELGLGSTFAVSLPLRFSARVS